ncbi:MAG: hypothetical protein MJ157_06790, partial [Clostridia bacterium]|nr:hypothetical protein [Clostridia bacterium]
KTGIEVNRRKVKGCARVKPGQIITVGGLDMVFMPLDKQGEREQAKARRFRANPVSQSATLLVLTLLQLVLSLSFLLSGGENPDVQPRLPMICSGRSYFWLQVFCCSFLPAFF